MVLATTTPVTHTPNGTVETAELLRIADHCVLCGLCLPHCPTYRLFEDENESPRGRISLLRALATGELPPDPRLQSHVSHCLTCRACETVCPSGVAYGKLIELGRSNLMASHRPALGARVALAVIAKPRRLRVLAWALRAYRASGIRFLARISGLLRIVGVARLDDMIPDRIDSGRLAPRHAACGIRRGQVVLFTGCLSPVVDAGTIQSAIRVLTQFGYEVLVPPGQVCCGGLHRELGDRTSADALARQNARALTSDHQLPVVTLISGCATALALSRTDQPEWSNRIVDIHKFLADLDLPPGMAIRPGSGRIAVHDPCSLRHGLRSAGAVHRLLARVPGLEILALQDNALCCGGAGGYVLREAQIADRLRNPKIETLNQMRPDAVVSANLGCALHLSAGLRARGLTTRVVHPIVVFGHYLEDLKR